MTKTSKVEETDRSTSYPYHGATSDMTNSPTHLPWEQSLGQFLAEVVQRNPDKVFLEISGHHLTYRQFDDAIKRTAGMFRALGIGHGDRVCLFLPNCAEFMYCWFGLSLIGAISVPINTAYKRDEAAYILNNAGASALVTHTSLLDVAREAAGLAPELRCKLLVGGAEQGWPGFTESLADASPIDSPAAVSPQDICMLVYTSGTTGNPKGVMLTHQMYVASGQGFAHWTEASSDDRFFTCLPFFHANAQYYSTMGTLAAGATLVVAGAVQCLPLLGTGARGQGHRGQLHRHDDARAVQTARVALG